MGDGQAGVAGDGDMPSGGVGARLSPPLIPNGAIPGKIGGRLTFSCGSISPLPQRECQSGGFGRLLAP